MTTHRMFLADLDALDEARATFEWQDGDSVDRVRIDVPRHEWEQAGRIGRITVVLADLSGARIDDSDALADAWDDGYKHGSADERRDDNARVVNPHWRSS